MTYLNLKHIFIAAICMLISAIAHADCFDDYAIRYGFEADLLRAIALTESNGNPRAISFNQSTQDLGLMQINSAWLTKWNFSREDLLNNVCLNVEIGAWILRENFTRFDNPWEAVGAYNASCSSLKGDQCLQARQRYAWKVYNNLIHLDPPTRERLKKALS